MNAVVARRVVPACAAAVVVAVLAVVPAQAGPGGVPGKPKPSPSPSVSPSPSPTPTPTPTPTATPPPVGAVALREPDAGRTDPYQGDLPADPNYLPTGVWFESVLGEQDVSTDRGAGINHYVVLTANSSLATVATGGNTAFVQRSEWLGQAGDTSGALRGWELHDEIDMQMSPAEARAAMQNYINNLPNDGRHRYNNFGKGVMFWWSDADATQMVNTYQHTVSNDNYWFTDPFICGAGEGGALLKGGQALTADECRRAQNYGQTVKRMRTLAGGDQPVWNFVEVGGPWSESRESCTGVTGTCTEYIKPREISAGVVHSFIAGARGIIYFNHSFGGAHQTQHALRESFYAPQRAEVTRINGVMTQVAPWINGQFADFNGAASGDVTVTGSIVASARFANGKFVVLAGHSGSRTAGSTTGTVEMPCVGDATAAVVGENRTVPVTGGVLSDAFADGLTTHVYSLDAPAACGVSGTTPTPTPTPTPTATTPPPTSPPVRTLTWADEFNGAANTAPDCTKWRLDNYDEGGRLNTWTRNLANAHHDGAGNMAVVAIKETSSTGRAYTSAQFKNQYVRPDLCPGATEHFQLYGWWEVRAKVPTEQGAFAAPLWTMGDYDATPGGWPECGEIDVIETINDATRAYGHVHVANASGGDVGPGVSKSGTWGDGFHVYAVNWQPGLIEWYVDGVLYGTITRAQVEAQGGIWVFDTKPQSPIITLAVGGWAGTPDPSWTSSTMLVDYVRVYS
jgi:hypothetical protein